MTEARRGRRMHGAAAPFFFGAGPRARQRSRRCGSFIGSPPLRCRPHATGAHGDGGYAAVRGEARARARAACARRARFGEWMPARAIAAERRRRGTTVVFGAASPNRVIAMTRLPLLPLSLLL